MKKYLVYAIFIGMCTGIAGMYWVYSAPIRAIDDANDANIPEMVVNTKIERLEDKLESTTNENDYLKNITPHALKRNIEDVVKIKELQGQLNIANKQVNDMQYTVNTTAAHETASHDAEYELPINRPINTVIKAPPKVNILKQVMAGKGSYTELYEKAQREQ